MVGPGPAGPQFPGHQLDNRGEPTVLERGRAPAGLFPNLGNQFSGIDDTGEIPPDVDIAAGYNVVIQTASQTFHIVSKCGTSSAEIDFDLWLDPPYEYYSARVEYDDLDQHWILVVARKKTGAQQAQILIMASQSGDPFGVWRLAAMDIHTLLPGGWPDYIDVSFDAGSIYLTWETYTWGGSPTLVNNGIR